MDKEFSDLIRQHFLPWDENESVDWDSLYLLEVEFALQHLGRALCDIVSPECIPLSRDDRLEKAIDIELLFALLSGSCLKDDFDGAFGYSERVAFYEETLSCLNKEQFLVILEVLRKFESDFVEVYNLADLDLLESAIERARLGSSSG